MTSAPQAAAPVVRRRTAYIDILTCIATFAVVWLHSNSLVHGFSDSPAWTRALVVEVIAYWAVPVFLMVSGVNLMRYRERYDTRTFLVKRVQRALIPFLFWVLLSYVWWLWRTDSLGWAAFSPRRLWEVFMLLEHMPTYWFFLALFPIYLAMPVLSLLRDQRRILWYIVGMGLALGSVMPLFAKILGLPWNGLLTFPLTAGLYVVFPILGYLLANTELSRRARIWIYLGGIAGAAIRFAVTYIGSYERGETYRLLFDYNSIVSIALAVAVFVAVKSVDWGPLLERRWAAATVRQITACSLGIYLTHYFVIEELLPRIGFTPERLVTQTLGAVIVFVASLAIVSVLRLVPGAKKVIPG
ncbi:MAG: acyltransferase [Microbacteriaceae bacterium]|nr:MAG: acyltransferase [Microbacteriaceae bacterium]